MDYKSYLRSSNIRTTLKNRSLVLIILNDHLTTLVSHQIVRRILKLSFIFPCLWIFKMWQWNINIRKCLFLWKWTLGIDYALIGFLMTLWHKLFNLLKQLFGLDLCFFPRIIHFQMFIKLRCGSCSPLLGIFFAIRISLRLVIMSIILTCHWIF